MALLGYEPQNWHCGALYRVNDSASPTDEVLGNNRWGGLVPVVLHIDQLQSMGLLGK